MIKLQVKQSSPSVKLTILNSLKQRLSLSAKSKFNIARLIKGVKGEQKFTNLIKSYLPKQAIILNNLLLKYDNSIFEIDCLLLTQNDIFIFEIKNYEGDFLIQDNKWYSVKTKSEIQNPLFQTERTNYLFQKLLNHLQFSFKPNNYLIFVNDEFSLYQNSVDHQIILPTQIPRLLRFLQTNSFHYLPKHHQLAKTLTEKQKSALSHLKRSLPEYHFSKLKKGILCTNCLSFLRKLNYRFLKCPKCESKVITDIGILNNVYEYTLLFPNKKITTHSIYKWCQIINSKKTIRRVLTKNLQQIYQGRYTYYIYPE